MEEACRAVSEDDGGAGDKGGCHPVIIEDGDHKFFHFSARNASILQSFSVFRCKKLKKHIVFPVFRDKFPF